MIAEPAATAWAMPRPAPASQFSRSAPIAAPVRVGVVEDVERQTLGAEAPFQEDERGHVDQLLRPAGTVGHRHGAERRSVAGAPGEEAAVEHEAAADEGADVEVDEVLQAGVPAERELGAAGGGGIVLQVDRPGQGGVELGADIRLPPGPELGRGRADLFGPAPEREGHREPEAGDPS